MPTDGARRSSWASCLACGLLLLTALVAAAQEEAAGETIFGAPASLDLTTDTNRVTVPQGTRVLERPAEGAPTLLSLDEESELEVIASQGRWRRVRVGSLKGWVRVDARVGATATGERAGVPPLVPVDRERLRRAREALGEARSNQPFGAFTLLTDVADEGLLRHLGAVASSLPAAFEQRYGLKLPPGDAQTVVLLQAAATFQQLVAQETGLAQLEAQGYAGGGVATLAVGDLDRDEVSALLVHELTHLLTRQALGNDLPAWLDEGMADDLAYSEIDAAGKLKLGSLGGSVRSRDVLGSGFVTGVKTQWVVETRGPRLALKRLLEAWDEGSRPPLADLLELSWGELVAFEQRSLRYAESAFFIRFLLSGPMAGAFRNYLGAIARGGPSDSDALLLGLRREPSGLERELREWLGRQAAEARLSALPPHR